MKKYEKPRMTECQWPKSTENRSVDITLPSGEKFCSNSDRNTFKYLPDIDAVFLWIDYEHAFNPKLHPYDFDAMLEHCKEMDELERMGVKLVRCL